MYKALFQILFFSLIIACSNSKKECEEQPINPNGESELALLMRELHNNTLDIKKNLFLNDSTSVNELSADFVDKFKYNYLAIRTASPTESNLRKNGIYNGYADLYINSSEKFLKYNSKKNYNLMINNCIQCHEHFCLGAISKINKLYHKKWI